MIKKTLTCISILFIMIIGMNIMPAAADWADDVKDDITTHRPRTLKGKAFMEEPITGATVRIYDRYGSLLYTVYSATREDGSFSITLTLPDSFKVVITEGLMAGKAFGHEVAAYIHEFDEAQPYPYKVNAVTTLIVEYMKRHPGYPYRAAKDAVARFLSLPEAVDLDQVIYASEWHSYHFSHYWFMKAANANGGVTAFMGQLVDELDAGQVRSFFAGDSVGSSLFKDVMEALLKGAASKAGGEGAGWILALLFQGGDNNTDARLTEMEQDLNEVLNDLTQIMNTLNDLVASLKMDTTDIETYIAGGAAQNAISTISNYYGPSDPTLRGDTTQLKYYSQCTSTNCNDDPTKTAMQTWVYNVNNNWEIELQVKKIYDTVFPQIGNTEGLLDLWTDAFIEKGTANGDTLISYYQTLEQYFSVLLFYQFQGANMVVEAKNYAGTDDAADYMAEFQSMIEQETDRFLYNVVRLITSNADLDSQADFLPAGAQDILARATFFIIQTLGQDHYGLRTGTIGTQQLVNTFPSMGTGNNSVVADASTDVELSARPYDAWSHCYAWNDKTLNYGDIYSYKSFDLSLYAGDPGTYPVWATSTCGGDSVRLGLGTAVVKTYTEDYVEDPDGTISYGYYAAPIRNGGREYMMAYLVEREDSVQKSGDVTYNSSGSLDQNSNLSLSLSAKNNDMNDASSISQTLEWYHPFTFTGSQAETAYLNISGSTSGSAYWQGDNGSGNESSISVNIGIWDVTHNQLVIGDSHTASASNYETKNLNLTLNNQLPFTLQPGVSYYVWANVMGSGDIHYTEGVSYNVQFSYNINLELDTLSLTFVNSGN